MEQMQHNEAEKLTIHAVPQKELADACYHSLGLIGRNCEYLAQHFAQVQVDDQTRQAVEDISGAAAKLERTMGEVMAALEYLDAEAKPDLHLLDLCRMLDQLAAQADMVRAQLGVTLELDYGGLDKCRVMADRRDTELLLLHLLSNALRACREGGRVQISLRRTGDCWQLTVRDDGCGLPGDDRDAWLENRRCFLGGAQLGLLLCRESCRRMGWQLQMEQAAPKGTRAVLTIPVYTGSGSGDAAMELHSGSDAEKTQQQYRLRAMLVREMRTMPERWDPEDLE